MDVGRAFSYVFEDPNWVKKVAIGGAILLVSAPLSVILIGLLGVFVVYGYMVEVVRRVHSGSPTPLPEWDDVGGFLTRGLGAFAGVIIWALPFGALFACAGIVSSTGNDTATLFGIFGYCLGFPLTVIFALIAPLIIARYAVTGKFGSMFEFSEIFAEARRAIGPLLITFVVYLIASFLSYFGLIACLIGIFFTGFYALLVYAHSIGQMYRQAQGLGNQPQTAF